MAVFLIPNSPPNITGGQTTSSSPADVQTADLHRRSLEPGEAETRICTTKPKTIAEHHPRFYMLRCVGDIIAIKSLVQGL